MRTGQNFKVLYFLLVICQIVLCNYAYLGPYLMLSILPAMIMCVPLSVSTAGCMFIAFITGLSVDWLSEGLIGINAASLIPVALTRRTFIRIFLGEDIINRNDSFSIRKNGFGKVSIVMAAAYIIFLAVYILLDGAGTRPLWFNLARGAASFACSWLISLIVVNTLTPDDRK